MTPTSQALSAALLHFVWQGTVVAFLLWVALLLLRNRAATARYAAACGALGLMAALPVATAWMVYQRTMESAPLSLAGEIPVAVTAIGATPRVWAAPLIEFAQRWALPVWGAGVLLFALRLALGYRHVAMLRRAGEAAESAVLGAVEALARRMSIARPVRVLVSTLADGPSVVGWLRPTILLPAAALAGLDAAQFEAILAHEMAHIFRHDFLVNALQSVAETLLFYHPATWWVSSRIRHERELCCDDLAVRHCGDAIGYARALTKLERIRVAPEPAVAANGGSLLYRIQRLTGTVRECGPSRLPAILALAAVAVCIPLTLHRAHAKPGQADAREALASAASGGQDQSSQPKASGGLRQSAGDSRTRTLLAEAAQSNGSAAPSQPPVRTTSIEYPPEALEKGISGTVVVEATLDADGNVADASVMTGPVELRKSALRSVLEWQFAKGAAGDVRRVSIAFKPNGVTDSQVDDAGRVTARARIVLDFLSDQLAKAQQELTAAAQRQDGSADRLRTQVAELEEKLEAARLAMALGDAERGLNRQKELANVQATLANREAAREQVTANAMNTQLEALLRQLKASQQMQNYTADHPEIVRLKAQIEALQESTMKFVAGRKLVRVERGPLPADFPLPVQIGDTLSESSIEAVVSAVNALDPDFEVFFFPVSEKEAVMRVLRR